MYHSITFGNKNTWDDWHLVSPTRPSFNPPTQKTMYIDIPGANGHLDLSESLTGYPIFNNREGEFEFLVMNDYAPWYKIYADISNYLHGKAMRAILEDDKGWFYEGRFSVRSWRSTTPRATIVIAYNVAPYKWSLNKSTDDWHWDPFNFETGVITQGIFKDIQVVSDISPTVKTFQRELFGFAPICPDFTVKTSSGNGMSIRYVNTALGVDITRHVPDDTTCVPEFIFAGGGVSLYFTGVGTVSINFRRGSL